MTEHNPKALRTATTLMPWLIWLLASLFYAYEFLQRVSISVYLPSLLRDLHTDAAGIGLMSAFFYYAYAGMQIPAGILIDWLGAKRLAAIGILLVSAGAFYFGTIHNIYAASIARFVIGLGSAFAFISCMKFIILWFPPYRFAVLAGLTNLAGYLGATAGEVPLTNFVHHFGWRWTAIATSWIGIIIAILIIIFVRDKPYKHHKEKTTPIRKTAPHIFTGIKKVFAKGNNWLNGLYAGLMVGPTSAFAALWGVNFLTHADHITKEIAAGALSAVFIGVASGSPIFGWWSDLIGKRQPLLALAAIGSMSTTLLIIYANHLSIVLIYVLCFLFGLFQSAHVLNFANAKDLNLKQNAGAAMGFMNMAVMLGGAILQPVIGLLLDWNRHGATLKGMTIYSRSTFHIALTVIPASQFLAFLIALFFLKDHISWKPKPYHLFHKHQ